MKRQVLSTAAVLVVGLVSACSTAPTTTAARATSERPSGMSTNAENFIGGAWATPPVESPDGCTNPDDNYCWTTEVGHESGCAKGFAFSWSFEDSYGDVILTGRERLPNMAAGQWKAAPFHIFTKRQGSYTPSVGVNGEATITSAACI